MHFTPFRLACRVALALVPVGLVFACQESDHPAQLMPEGTGGHPVVGVIGPCTDWAVHDCHIELGRSGDVAQCATGHQTCQNGMWGACIADETIAIQSVAIPREELGGLSPEVVGNAAKNCASNPCDPNCEGFLDSKDGGKKTYTPDAGGGATGGGTLSGSNVPGGFQQAGSDKNGNCTPGCVTATCQAACQFDQHCSSTTNGVCQAYSPNETGCTGVDYTIGVSCNTATDRVFPVCNRGTAVAPAGAKCYVFPGNSLHMPALPPIAAQGTLVFTTTSTIASGKCITVTVANANFSNSGTNEFWCDPPAGTTECNAYNNYSATKKSPVVPCITLPGASPVAVTQTRVFQATCAAGYGPTWVNFGYTTTTPVGTNVAFRFRAFPSVNGVCTPLTPVNADPPAPAATASTVGDPQVCPITGAVAGCPKPLDTYLDFPDQNYDCLQMDARLNPSASAGPVLFDWTVNFDCRANK